MMLHSLSAGGIDLALYCLRWAFDLIGEWTDRMRIERIHARTFVIACALVGATIFVRPGRLSAQQSARIQVSANVVRVPVQRSQIEAAEQRMAARLSTLERGQQLTGEVGRVGVQLSSGAQLRLDPPAALPATTGASVDRPHQLTLAYLAN
jgi:hypothetical protein